MVQIYKKILTYASRSQEKFHFSPFISKSVCQRSFALIRVGHNYYYIVFVSFLYYIGFALYLSCALYNILYLLAFVFLHIEMTDIISLRKFVQPTAHI